MTTTKATISQTDLRAALDETQLLLYRDRRRAHATLFSSDARHSESTPEFHGEIIDDFHSTTRNICWIAFRGAAKTTIAEEATVVRACFREFRNCLIVSSTSDIAEMRLHAIRKQFEMNESILEIFGNLRSKPWEDNHIELSSGVVIRAVGRGQAIRGTKDEDVRPDFILADDIEDLKSVANATQLQKTRSWFDTELIASGDAPTLMVRMLANDMGPDCLANKLKLPNSGFSVKVYPWIVKDKQGNEKAIWESRYPLSMCRAKRAEMYERGSGDDYEREFMCSSERPEAKIFRDDMLKIDARVRVYEPVYASVIPEPMKAGTQPVSTSAAIWSWMDDKIVVWELWTKNLSSAEIVSEINRIEAEYTPVKIIVPQKSFEDWLHAVFSLPNIVSIKAPSSELDFIRAMQPFFVNKQIVFSSEPKDAWPQFSSFPNGPTLAPLALAFSLHPLLRDADVMYEDFSTSNVLPDLMLEPGPTILALNADDRNAVGALIQSSGRSVKIFADWVESGDPTESARAICQKANFLAQRRSSVVMPQGSDRVSSALRKIGIQVNVGASSENGRAEIRRMLKQKTRGYPDFIIDASAAWSRNGFLQGFTQNEISSPYKTLLSAIESVCGLASFDEMENGLKPNAVARDGREFFSARAVKHA